MRLPVGIFLCSLYISLRRRPSLCLFSTFLVANLILVKESRQFRSKAHPLSICRRAHTPIFECRSKPYSRSSDDSNGAARANHTDMGMADAERKRLADNRTDSNRSEGRNPSRIDMNRGKSRVAKTGQRTAADNIRSSHRNQRQLMFLHSQLSGLEDN